MQKFDGEDYRPALPVFFSGERANGGPCRSPFPPLPFPPHLLRPPTKSPATQATAEGVAGPRWINPITTS